MILIIQDLCFLLDKDSDQRYEFIQENPTISNLVQPPIERQNPDNPYTVRDQYTTDSRRTGDTAYESTRRPSDNRQEIDRRSNEPQYTRRVPPTADVYVDRSRRPVHGTARRCVMEVNIAVTLGADRTSQASITTNNYTSKPPNIRSTAFIDDVRYVDLSFRSPENTAQLSTDGIIRQSSPRGSIGFGNKNTNE